MTEAATRLREGDLAGCLQDLQAEVRRNPGDSRSRIFLAQLLMVMEDWDRAIQQLKVVAEMDAASIAMARTYTAAIACERLRTSVLQGRRSPLIFGAPEPWMALLVQSAAALAAGQAQQADALRAQAFADAPATAGKLDGVEFEWIADADSRLGPMLEVFLNGSYFWVPFKRIAAVKFEPPVDLRDLVWMPAQFTWTNGGEAVGFVPSRYAGSHAGNDPALRLSRRTEWSEIGADAFAGSGQRVLTTSAEEKPLLETRELLLQAAA